MHFRPYPVLSLFAAIIFAICIMLGVWQLNRTAWKRGLIADFEAAAAADPMSLDQALCAGEPLGRIVAAEGVLHGPPSVGNDLRMFGQDELGTAGWTHLTAIPPPACVASEGAIMVEAGFEPFEPDPANPRERTAQAQALPLRFLVVAWPGKPSFAAANAPESNDWHWFDAPAMAEQIGVERINSRYYLSTFTGQLPERLRRTPPATHIGYAITWFGMAAALILIYAAFHARAGRLRFSGKNGRP